MRRRLSIPAALLSLSLVGYAQQPAKHAIDKTLETCLDRNPSTAGMVECIDKAYAGWDRELNRCYTDLMKKLGPEAGQKLKESQIQWLKFRDLEFGVLDSIYSRLDGTMYIPMRADSRMEIVKKRALELKSHLELLKESQ